MSNRNFRQDIEGYKEIAAEIAVLQKYAVDRKADRGAVERVVNRLHPQRLHLRISEIRKETESTSTLRLVSQDDCLPPFQAGQYINLFVKMGNVSTARPYSISSSPAQTAYYDITVRRVDEGFVSCYLLDKVKPGDSFESTSPAGHFYYNPLFHGSDLIFIAGGSGITPFISMIREVTDRGLDRNIHLIYGSRSSQDIIFCEELEDRALRHQNFTFTPVISEPAPGYQGRTGFITGELIRKLAGNTAAKMFYLCGPEAMYQFCLPELSKLGVPGKRIRREVFGTPKNITAEQGWPASVSGKTSFKLAILGGKTIAARAGESLMVAMERAGLVIPNSCRSGECSLCRTKLLSGDVFQLQGAKVRKSDRHFGYIHACMAYPLTNVEIMI